MGGTVRSQHPRNLLDAGVVLLHNARWVVEMVAQSDVKAKGRRR